MNTSFTARNFPFVLFFAIWIFTFFLFSLNPFGIRPLSSTTSTIIFIGVFSVLVGINISTIIFKKYFLPISISNLKHSYYLFNHTNVLKLLKITILFSIVGIFLELIVLDKISGSIIDYFSNPIKGRQLYVDSITNTIGNWNKFQSLANYFLDFNYFSSILGGLYISITSNRKKYALIPLLLAFITSIITFQRFFFVHNFSIWLFSIIIISNVLPKTQQIKTVKIFFKTFLSVGLFFIIFSFLLISVRASFGKENIKIEKISEYVIKSNYLYVAGNLGGLNNYVDKAENKPLMLGHSTFRGVEKWLARFGLIDQQEVIGSNYEFTKVGKGWVNTYTFLRIFYEDFGIPGVLILGFLWGFIGNLLYIRISKNFSFILLYFVSTTLFSYFLSFYSFAYTALTLHIFLAIIILIFEKIIYKPNMFYTKINV